MRLNICWFKCVWAGSFDLRMLSVCHSLIKTTSKQRAACISRCSLVDSNRTIHPGMFSRSLSNCIKRNFRSFDMSQVTPISGGNVRQNTRGTSSNHQPTQHFANKFKYNISRCMRPFSNTMRKERFISKRCRRRQQWNCSSSSPQSVQRLWHTPNEPLHFLNQWRIPKLTQRNNSSHFWNKTCKIKIYISEKKHQIKFAASRFTWGKKTPKLQHQNLREEKNTKFKTSNFTWEKKTNLQH